MNIEQSLFQTRDLRNVKRSLFEIEYFLDYKCTLQLSMGAQIGQSGSVEIVGLSENKIGTHLTLLG